jgi:putative ABC transport system permease protein
MIWLRMAAGAIRALFCGKRDEKELEDELGSYIQAATEEKMRDGMGPEAAWRAARAETGSTAAIRDYVRDAGWESLLEDLWHDLGYGIRLLRNNLGFTLVAVLTLAMGIGLNAAVFSAVYAVLINSLPYPHPDRLVMVWERVHLPTYNSERNDPTPGDFADWKGASTVFQDMAAIRYRSFSLTGAGEPQQVEGEAVSSSLFSVVQVKPELGRTFTAEEDRVGAKVVVMGHELWASRFGSDPAIVGKAILLDDEGYTVIGIMPPGFHFPDPDDRLWVPISFSTAELANRGSHYLRIVGRLQPGVTLAQADAQLQAIAARMTALYPQTNTGETVNLVSLRDQVVGAVQKTLLVLLGAVGLVLLITCVNLANMLLARASARRREMAIRTALGASPARIARQVVTESVLLAGLGGTLGLVLAAEVAGGLRLLNPSSVPRANEIVIQWPVFLFTAIVSLLTGILFGIAPALACARSNVQDAMRRSLRERGSNSRLSARNLLVVAQTALGVMVIVGAGLLLRSFMRLQQTPLGFQPQQLLTLRVIPRGEKYQLSQQRTAFYQQVMERIEALPGVRSAAAVSFIPLTFAGGSKGFTVEGREAAQPGQLPMADYDVVTPGYFRTLQTPLLAGRDFTWSDTPQSQAAILINQSMARRYWGHQDPIGRRIKECRAEQSCPWLTVIGIVGDMREYDVPRTPRPTVYFPATQFASPRGVLRDWVIRTSGDPLNVAQSVREAIRSVDATLPVSRVQTMEQVRSASIMPQQFSLVLFGSFALLALLLAAVGIYGVVSYAVSRSTHEIGVRMALGANARAVLAMVLGNALRLALAGIAIGVLAALAASQVMSALLFGVSAADPLTFVGVALLVAAVTLTASYIPARRAARVDPLVALRYE